jgi:hypothetical protein
MSTPARKLNNTFGQMDLQKLESELLSLPFIVRRHLAHTLLDSVDEGVVETDAHRRAMETGRGEAEDRNADGASTDFLARQEADVEAAWAEEAHRRWEAYQRGEEEMLDFDEVMAEIRTSFRR